MIRVTFHNMASQQSVIEAIQDRLSQFQIRFPHMRTSIIQVQVSSIGDSRHRQPNVYSVKLRCHGGEFDGLVVEKKSVNFYKALQNLVESLKVSLDRRNKRIQTKTRQKERRKNPKRVFEEENLWKLASGD